MDFILEKTCKKIGENIKNIRIEKGVSQLELSIIIENISQTTISHIEQGKHSMGLKTILKISNGLDVNLEEIFKGV